MAADQGLSEGGMHSDYAYIGKHKTSITPAQVAAILAGSLSAAVYGNTGPTATNIILNAEGKGTPSTAPQGVRRTSRIYYRKIDCTTGVELKAAFSDVNIGNLSSSTIQGGPAKSIFYGSYTLPSKPLYGDAKLTNLYHGIPVTAVSRANNSSLPNLNVWRGKQTSFTEGTAETDETPILAFMSHIDTAENIYEGFEGASGPGKSRRIGNNVVTTVSEFLPATWAWNNIQSGTKQGLSSKEDFIERYCIPGKTGRDSSGYICPVVEKFSAAMAIGSLLNPWLWGDIGRGITKKYMPTEGKDAWDLIEPTWDYISVVNAGYPHTEVLEYSSEDVDIVADVNSNNSIFEVKSNNINLSAADASPIYEASCKFSGERVLTGSYSAKMRTYYSKTTTYVGEFPDYKDSGATNRQEVLMQYGPLPYPTAMDMEGASDGTETAYRINFDMFIDKLAPAWSAGSGVDEDRLVRGICVTLSDTRYHNGEGTLYDWIKSKDDDTDEFAYFFIWNTSQNSANAADGDHMITLLGSDENHLGSSGASFDDDGTNKMIRVKSGVDPYATAGLSHTSAGGVPMGEWIHVDLATIPYMYGWRLRLNTPAVDGSENTISAFQLRTTDNSRQATPANWTPYIQIWLVNYPSDTSNDGAFAADQDTESVVFIDNFSVSNSNYTLENATVCEENAGYRTNLSFGSNTARDETNGTHDSARILSLGFNDTSDFPDGTLKNLLFSGFGSSNVNDTSALANASALWAWSSYSTANASHLKLGWPMAHHTDGLNTYDANYAFTDGSSPSIGLTDGGTIGSLAPDAGAGTEVAWAGTTGVEGFSQKGLIQVSFDDSTYSNFTLTKRENHFVKARVLKVIEASTKQGVFMVDNPEVFRVPTTRNSNVYETTFRMYLHNTAYATDDDITTGARNLRFVSLEGNVVTLAGNCVQDADGGSLANIANIPYLCISPMMYWLVMYYTWDDGTDILPDRFYTTVHNINSGVAAGISAVNYGATWNEHKFTDAPTYDNSWSWGKTGDSNLITTVDYGYGAYDTELKSGGYVGKFKPDASSPTGSLTTGTRHNIVDISGMVSADDVQPDETIALAIAPDDDLATHAITISTEDASAGERPFILAGFTDNVGSPPGFSVVPYSEDPTKYQFDWSVEGKDWWYGFIIIDKEPILNKYHKVGMHIPNFFSLASYDGNVDLASGTNSGLKYYNYPENQTRDLELDSTFAIDFEGICGLTPKFDGDAYIRADSDHMDIDDPGPVRHPPTTNMTVMAHVRIDSTNVNKEIMSIEDGSSNVAFKLTVASGMKFEATVAPASGTAVVLTSTTQIMADNETPYAICVTVDTEIPNGNVKLFINGRLEDQSGLLTTAGSSDNWKSGQSIDDPGGGYVYLGNDDSTNGFIGTIEEVVISNRTYYPVVVSDGQFICDKNFEELVSDSTGSSQSYSARLVLCDYHNISGKTGSEITMSSPISIRKTAFRVRGD